MTDGTELSAEHLVVATESTAAAKLLGIQDLDTSWNEATTLYFAAESAPDRRKLLMLRGDESGPVQTATVLSNTAPEYAPRGKALMSVSLGPLDESLDADDLEQIDSAVREQLRGWFGNQVNDWRRLCAYRIPYGVPRRSLDPVLRSVEASDLGGSRDVYVCGDHCETPSIQGAMNSGIRVAEAILERIAGCASH